ncbi:MAG TPA: hypothetical protein VE954_13485 [Oligoflexus sp.]|uniref:hypothetical protein n=1 Tax=Oligoflexus sp. TaxID=1971216 RepID=UPI002D70C99E|nr:hypothetical protein [Oligoflexus sp.]HYX34115.1 hypothetical protein [Oligoflexus sp.]
MKGSIICTALLLLFHSTLRADDTLSAEQEDHHNQPSTTLLTASFHWLALKGGLFEYASIQPDGDGMTYFYDYYHDKYNGETTATYNMLGTGYRYFLTKAFYLKGRISLGYRTLAYQRYMGVEFLTRRRFGERFLVDGWSIDAALEAGHEWRWDRWTFGISYYAHPANIAWGLSRVRHRKSLDLEWDIKDFEEGLKEPLGSRVLELNLGILL